MAFWIRLHCQEQPSGMSDQGEQGKDMLEEDFPLVKEDGVKE